MVESIAVVLTLLREGFVPLTLKEAVKCSFFKRPALRPVNLDNYYHASNLPFWGKFVKKVVILQLQSGEL